MNEYIYHISNEKCCFTEWNNLLRSLNDLTVYIWVKQLTMILQEHAKRLLGKEWMAKTDAGTSTPYLFVC